MRHCIQPIQMNDLHVKIHMHHLKTTPQGLGILLFQGFSASTQWQEFETTSELAGVKTYHQLNSEFMSVVNLEE